MKAARASEIPAKIFKQKADTFRDYICMFFHECVDLGYFIFVLKHANITLVCKKGYRGSKGNYCPVSVFPIISKTFEKLLCLQITLFMEEFLSKYQCGFCKGSSA